LGLYKLSKAKRKQKTSSQKYVCAKELQITPFRKQTTDWH